MDVRVIGTRTRMCWMGARVQVTPGRVKRTRARMSWMGARIPTARLRLRRSVVQTKRMRTRMSWMGARIPTARLRLRRSVVETKRIRTRMSSMRARIPTAQHVSGDCQKFRVTASEGHAGRRPSTRPGCHAGGTSYARFDNGRSSFVHVVSSASLLRRATLPREPLNNHRYSRSVHRSAVG